MMTAQVSRGLAQKATRVTLSTSVQALLYLSLCGLILWTLYFTTYPPIHDRVHSLRHHTLTVSCH